MLFVQNSNKKYIIIIIIAYVNFVWLMLYLNSDKNYSSGQPMARIVCLLVSHFTPSPHTQLGCVLIQAYFHS